MERNRDKMYSEWKEIFEKHNANFDPKHYPQLIVGVVTVLNSQVKKLEKKLEDSGNALIDANRKVAELENRIMFLESRG